MVKKRPETTNNTAIFFCVCFNREVLLLWGGGGGCYMSVPRGLLFHNPSMLTHCDMCVLGCVCKGLAECLNDFR